VTHLDAGFSSLFQEALIEKYILNRVAKMPESHTDADKLIPSYWKLLVYEMLFMWNALNSCSPENLQKIIDDCGGITTTASMDVVEDGAVESVEESDNVARIIVNNNTINEPMLGLTKLIIGLCHVCLKNVEEAINALRECIAVRVDEFENDMHVSAFAHYELAMLLLKHRKNVEVSQENHFFSESVENTTQQIMNKILSCENNQRILLNFGALSPILFLDFSQHVRFLR
jgi:hypothetical protein